MKYLINFIVLLVFFISGLAKNKVQEVKFATVIFPKGHIFQLEVADTMEKWIRGLMFRKYIADNGGMLFVYPKDNFYSIWMKNCFISLDLIWVDSKGRVIYIVENAPPCKKEPCPVYEPMMKARFVIELKAGTVKKLNIKPGDRISIILPEKK